MRKAGKFGPQGAGTAPEGAREDTLRTAEASETAARRSSAAAPAPLDAIDAGLGSAAPQAPGHPLLRLLDGAVASDSDASGSAAAGAPSPAPPELAGAAAAGTPANLGPIASTGPAPPAWPPRPARRRRAARPEARSSPRRPGRRGRPEAGRRGAGDPGSRRQPPCPAPV